MFQKDPHIIDLIQQAQVNGVACHEPSATCYSASIDTLVNVSVMPLKNSNEKTEGVVITLEKVALEHKFRTLFKRKIRNHTINELIANGTMLNLSGETRELTVLNLKITNMPSLYQYMPPAEIFEILNAYFQQIRKTAFKYHGMIHKFEPNECVIVFGAPIETTEAANCALQTAFALIQVFATLNKAYLQIKKCLLQVAIGICSGKALVGSILLGLS